MAQPLTYQFFGPLFLPAPEDLLSPEHLAQLRRIEPLLRKLARPRSGTNVTSDSSLHANSQIENRVPLRDISVNRGTAPSASRQPALKPVSTSRSQAPWDYVIEFEKWKKVEVATWLPIVRPEAELVSASGSIDARIAMQLHFPTFVTAQRFDGEVADNTNPCIALLYAKGFTHENSFIFDHFCRRENSRAQSPSVEYPEGPKACHTAWTGELRSHMTAKVEVVWGKPMRQLLFNSLALISFTLWGSCEGLEIYLEKDEVGNGIKRIIIPVDHPQFFLHPHSRARAILQDRKLNLAARLAGVRVAEHFFEQHAAEKCALSHDSGSKHGTPRWLQNRDTIFFTTMKMRALETFGMNEEGEEVFEFEDLPAGMKQWLQNEHKHFGERVTSTEQIRTVCRNNFCSDLDPDPLEAGLKTAIFVLFYSVWGSRLGRAGGSPKIIPFVVFREPGYSVEVKCQGCGRRFPTDQEPRFWKTAPKWYIAYGTKVCRSSICGTKRRWLIPQDKIIPWIPGKMEYVNTIKRNPTWISKETMWADYGALEGPAPCDDEIGEFFTRVDVKPVSEPALEVVSLHVQAQEECIDELIGAGMAHKDGAVQEAHEDGTTQGPAKGRRDTAAPLASAPRKRRRNMGRMSTLLIEGKDVSAELKGEIEAKCNACGAETCPIKSPRWTKEDPPRLYVPGTSKECGSCGKSAIHVPKDEDIPHVTNQSLGRVLDRMERETGIET